MHRTMHHLCHNLLGRLSQHSVWSELTTTITHSHSSVTKHDRLITVKIRNISRHEAAVIVQGSQNPSVSKRRQLWQTEVE